jgi:PAS domain S-box-containing protein
MTVQILLTDDQKVVRQGLRMFLDLDPELEVVGEASNGEEALRLARRLEPDVVLMDLVMPVMDGIEATGAIRKELPDTEVVALTSVLEDASVSGAVRAGAIGYLLKTTEAEELCEAIKAAADNLGAAIGRNRAEQALKQERDFSSAVLDTAGSLVVVFDIEGRIVRFNRACEHRTGYSFEEIQGRRYWEVFLAPEDVEPVRAVMEEVRSRRLPNTNENNWVMRDGSRRLISWSNAILLDEQGEPAYLIGTGIDITEQRQAEDELKESQRALTTLMSNLPGMAYRCRNDEDWTMEFVSEGSLGLTGHAPEDLVGNRRVSYGDLIHPDDRERVWEKVQAGLEECRPFQFNYRMRAASGEMKWVWEQGRGVFSSRGELLALEGFITDVTERVLSRQMLEQRVASLTRIAANLTIDQPMETTLRTLAASVSEASTGEGCSVTLIDEASPAFEHGRRARTLRRLRGGSGSILARRRQIPRPPRLPRARAAPRPQRPQAAPRRPALRARPSLRPRDTVGHGAHRAAGRRGEDLGRDQRLLPARAGAYGRGDDLPRRRRRPDGGCGRERPAIYSGPGQGRPRRAPEARPRAARLRLPGTLPHRPGGPTQHGQARPGQQRGPEAGM